MFDLNNVGDTAFFPLLSSWCFYFHRINLNFDNSSFFRLMSMVKVLKLVYRRWTFLWNFLYYVKIFSVRSHQIIETFSHWKVDYQVKLKAVITINKVYSIFVWLLRDTKFDLFTLILSFYFRHSLHLKEAKKQTFAHSILYF